MQRVRRLAKLLARVIKELQSHGAKLAYHRQRWQHFHDLAHAANVKSQAFGQKADELRKKGAVAKAARLDKKAQNQAHKAQKFHTKAIVQLQAVKRQTQIQQKLAQNRDDLKKRLEEAKQQANKVTISGNKATGGSAQERLKVCMLASAHACASGHRPNFYSQAGAWDVSHCITGEARGHRSDCSSWATSVFWSCGLPDPNGDDYRGGYTGTLGTHGHRITRGQAAHESGARVLFGYAPYHHVELAIGDGTEHTIGHGSPPVDMGTFNLLPGPVTFVGGV